MTVPVGFGLAYEIVESPIGPLVLVSGADATLHVAEFADQPQRIRTALARHGTGFDALPRREGPSIAALALSTYFAGSIGAIDEIAAAGAGTPFQKAVWQALRRVPCGQSMAYSAMAEHLGRPNAARAVGHANGANPIAVVVPCHRLVGASGALTGYGGGVERKRWLLSHEAEHVARLRRATD